ncbi:hypothetical protein BDR26DRAFT_873411 [Obelidium mucronatum]|nr:hypothetical protein BDR26DRAFT_879636 [Obelidium mucronatum]KAI9328826.1 hypothetical protein BDR26DRAFT_873411 [Obelidium mucronatum]
MNPVGVVIFGVFSAIVFRFRQLFQPYLKQLQTRFLGYQQLLPLTNASTSSTQGLSFSEAQSRGLDSESFVVDLDDQRPGFVREAAEEVQRLMETNEVDFDEARLLLVKQQMRDNGIDPETGLPLDPRAVTFS